MLVLPCTFSNFNISPPLPRYQSRGPLRILFLSADTGGGHRASAESLAKQFLLRYPGSTYNLLDIWSPCGLWPYKTLVDSYKYLSAHPKQWGLLYHLSNSLPWEIAMDTHTRLALERSVTRLIERYDPDVIVSVHPAMNHVPIISAKKLSRKKGKHIPFFTVVTDLGSAHATWFQRPVEKIYVASNRTYRLARRRGLVPKRKIVMAGLPIRYDFAQQAHQLNDRTTETGQLYQRQVKEQLGLPVDSPMILVMGGGEGVGMLSSIVDEMYAALVQKGMDATICVICGRNEKLKKQLEERQWDQIVAKLSPDSRLKRRRRRRERRWNKELSTSPVTEQRGNVSVVGLGFVTNMAEYMVASDVLVTKAGPGTIAEAASVGLPVLMTSFLPGQEAGNVDYVIENGFGDYCDDPVFIADQVSTWLQNPTDMAQMSRNAQLASHPDAAAEIVQDIGSITHTWMALNEAK